MRQQKKHTTSLDFSQLIDPSLLSHTTNDKMGQNNEEDEIGTEALINPLDADLQSSNEAAKVLVPDKSWWIIFPLAHSGFGLYFGYDSIGAVAPLLKSQLGITSGQIGVIFSAFSIATVFLVFFGGMLFNRFGASKILVVGNIITTIGTFGIAVSHTFPQIFAGQLLFGIGGANLYLAIVATIGAWFQSGPRSKLKMTVAMGCTSFWLRMASFCAYNVLPLIANKVNLRAALLFTSGMCFLSLLSSSVFAFLEARERKVIERFRYASIQSDFNTETDDAEIDVPKKQESSLLSKVISLPLSYWMLMILSITTISSLYTFTSFGTTVLKEERGYSVENAARITSFVSVANALTTPFISLVVGLVGFRTYFAIFGASVLAVLFGLFGFTSLWPELIFPSLGLTQSVMDSILFPSISLVVPPELLGFSTGLVICFYNIGLLSLPIVIGFLQESGFTTAATGVFTVMGIVGIVASLFLKFIQSLKGNPLDKK